MRIFLIGLVFALLPFSASAQSIKSATFGCNDWDVYKRISMMYAQGDTKAAAELYARSILNGTCRDFEEGEKIFISEGGYTAKKVRKKGEIEAYWVPVESITTK